MAPIKNILAALALASFTTAIPVAVDKRANIVTETTWTTVDVTTTVYINGASPMPQADNAPPPAPAVPTTTAAAESSAAPEQQPAAQSPGNAPAAFAAQPPQPSSPVVSSSSAAPVATEPAAPASSPATESTQGTQGSTGKSSGGSTGGPCEGSGSGCSGDATHWDGGLGACGWNVNTASDMQIALPVGLMGSQSNGNPYCGRSVSIKGTNGIVSATVGDKCMGCTGDSIDMTDALFAAALPDGDGRVKNVEWWFN